MNMLVTGAAGFIGSELVSQIVAAGHRVIALDSLATGRWENLDGLGEVECITGDVRDGSLLQRILPRVSVVFHLACLNLRQSLLDPVGSHDVNASGTLNLLETARRAAIQRIVQVSSCEIYGTASTVPMTELHPASPTTPYGASKLAGEAYARAYHRSYGLPVTIVRPFNSYGPRCHHENSSGEVIPKFMLRALAGLPLVIFGDGTQTRDFTYVSDTARGIMLAGLTPQALGETINLGSGAEVSIRHLAARIAPQAQCIHEAPRPGDVQRLLSCTARASALLGYRASVGLDEGLQKLDAWYKRLDATPEQLLQTEVVRNWASQ